MRKIIILSNATNDDGTQSVKYVFWVTIPPIFSVKSPGIVSLVPDITPPELSSLQDGSVLEQSGSLNFNDVGSAASKLIENYNEIKNFYVQKLANSQDYSGVYWDGTNWINAPVPKEVTI